MATIVYSIAFEIGFCLDLGLVDEHARLLGFASPHIITPTDVNTLMGLKNLGECPEWFVSAVTKGGAVGIHGARACLNVLLVVNVSTEAAATVENGLRWLYDYLTASGMSRRVVEEAFVYRGLVKSDTGNIVQIYPTPTIREALATRKP